MKQYEYKGYQMLVRKNADWTAAIRRPNATTIMSVHPQASLEEGLVTLLSRVKAVIDEDIERTGPTN